jgi:hypothetical protein
MALEAQVGQELATVRDVIEGVVQGVVAPVAPHQHARGPRCGTNAR